MTGVVATPAKGREALRNRRMSLWFVVPTVVSIIAIAKGRSFVAMAAWRAASERSSGMS